MNHISVTQLSRKITLLTLSPVVNNPGCNRWLVFQILTSVPLERTIVILIPIVPTPRGPFTALV